MNTTTSSSEVGCNANGAKVGSEYNVAKEQSELGGCNVLSYRANISSLPYLKIQDIISEHAQVHKYIH